MASGNLLSLAYTTPRLSWTRMMCWARPNAFAISSDLDSEARARFQRQAFFVDQSQVVQCVSDSHAVFYAPERRQRVLKELLRLTHQTQTQIAVCDQVLNARHVAVFVGVFQFAVRAKTGPQRVVVAARG